MPCEGKLRKFSFSGGASPIRRGFNFLGVGSYPSAYHADIQTKTSKLKQNMSIYFF